MVAVDIRCEEAWVIARRLCRETNELLELPHIGIIFGGCHALDLVRAFVRALVLLEIDAARRVAAAVRDRVFRAGAVMSTAACTAARRLERFRVGTLVIGADTLGRGCVVGAIDRVMR